MLEGHHGRRQTTHDRRAGAGAIDSRCEGNKRRGGFLTTTLTSGRRNGRRRSDVEGVEGGGALGTAWFGEGRGGPETERARVSDERKEEERRERKELFTNGGKLRAVVNDSAAGGATATTRAPM
jgi:hypothetical protein